MVFSRNRVTRGRDTVAWSTPRKGLTVIDGAIALIAVLLIVQMWLLTATLEAYLAGHHDVALPALVFSLLLTLGCFGLYLFLERVDREMRRASRY